MGIVREIKHDVYSKRQVPDSRLRFLKITKKCTTKVLNNSGIYDLLETTQRHLETANEEWQTRRKHGHMVISVVCHLP